MEEEKQTLSTVTLDEDIVVCTTVSKNYLAYARILSRSLREQHPSIKIFVLLVDHLEGAFDPGKEPFDVIELEELDNIPEPKNFIFKYKPIELNTAAKPYLFEYLFRKYGLSKLIFLDPDILVLDSLKTVWDLLDSNNIILTPHITEPYTDDRHPDEKHILQSGIFNLGFIAMANTPVTNNFLKWWQKRLYEFCFMDISQGMHVDQNWVNFAPVMYEGVHILKDPAYNIAYWNLHSHGFAMAFEKGKWKIHGKPVVFFHFSGFDLDNIDKISIHQTRFTLNNFPHLRPLLASYRDRLLAEGHKECREWRYAYGYFDNGVPITEYIRKLYNAATKGGNYFSNPFSTSQSQSFFNWLNQSMEPEEVPQDYSITRLIVSIYSTRGDLKVVYQNLQGMHRKAFFEWLRTFGKKEYQLDDAFIPGTERFRTFSFQGARPESLISEQKENTSQDRSDKQKFPAGVNYAGCFKGEFGVAVAARNYIYALQTTKIPYVLNNIIALGHRHHDKSFHDFSDGNPYYVNIIHQNADQAKPFFDLKGRQYFKDHYNIGFWVWELEKFPAKFFPSFQHYQEIWVPSEFCRQSISRVSPVPVTKIKHPIILDEQSIKPDRKRFLLPEGEFILLFVFDYLSVFERKNPMDMIQAFQKAFNKTDKVCLLIKSINSHRAPEKAAHIQSITNGYNIRFIDGHLEPEDMLSLMASVDCFVSLHRSEGFGLGLAQSMYLGKPVIATGYSGNMDFMNSDNSFLVDYKLVELDKDYGPYEKGNIWAEPSNDHAAELMRLVYSDRALAEKKARQGALDIKLELSPQAIGAEMQARVRQIYGGQTPSFQKTTEVSIIIPAFNRLNLTRQCIDSIRQTAGNISYEIIVADNGSTDGTSDYLRQEQTAGRIRAVFNQKNLGFAKACNQGAKAAKGKYLLFLNNDTLPQPKWLEEMVQLAESDKNIGIVGSKMLFPDGTIQHAGVVVSSSKLPYHIYRGLPGDTSCANKQRDYQIVTAACMLIKEDLFSEVGGFDERFMNGCEDLDLCLKTGQKNKRVVYNPRSVLTHFEAQSEGRQDKMDFNRRLFLSIWKDKIQQDDRHFLEQDGMKLQIGVDGSFKFIPSDKLTPSATEPKSLKPSIIIVTYNSSSTIRACLDSVLKYTPNAEVIVVDNASADDTRSILKTYEGRITAILNTENKGFSFACNQGIRASKGEYVVLLNPDTIVTPMWKERLLAHFSPGVGAVGPLSNYTNEMQLSKYYSRDSNWDSITSFNERAEKLYEWNRGQGRETKLLMGFCLALPRKLLDKVGLLDEDLFLGSEDLEISWRLRQKGYKLMIAADAFIYHEGQVSFKSQKVRPSTKESDQNLYKKLVAHYGEGNVPHPMELWGVDYFNPEGARFRSMKASFAAVYCVYDDTTWLRESLESVYETVDAVYFLISDKPWQGQPTDNTATRNLIKEFPDPNDNIKVIEGTWTNEADQRNAGLDLLKEAGFTYCFVIDADEIYDPAELKRMMELAVSRQDVDCWHVFLDTYWKSSQYRIEPREKLNPPVFLKVGSLRFTKNRTAKGNNPMVIPPEVGICHHLSYARSDEEVLKKITTFSHAHEVKPGWFENVWKKWDTDHSLTNLHPTHPAAYQRAIEQPYSALPPVLRKIYVNDLNTKGDRMADLTSIIILAHNQWDHTGLCLKSIEKHTPEPHEIIIVDNGSTDETRERLRALVTRGGLKVILNNTNRGFAAGNNQGLSIAQGNYILLLNNDTIVTPGWLGRMTEVFRRYPDTGIVGPMSNNVTRPQLVDTPSDENTAGIDDFAVRWTRDHEGQSFSTSKASGFCLLTRKEVIDKIGGLDEQFGSGNFEDDDFCSRAFLSGFEIRIAQDVFIHHIGRQTFKGAGIDYNAKMIHNWELYKAKWNIPKDTEMEHYWVPSRLPDDLSPFFPLPDISYDHTADPENRWWEDIRKKEEQGKSDLKLKKKERVKGLTSIIIYISEEREYARKCVESIRNNTDSPHEIIFVPSDSSYAPSKWLSKLIKANKNYRLAPPSTSGSATALSYSQAYNNGIAQSKGEYIAILQHTCQVTAGWLTGMLECFSTPDTAVIGPMSVNAEGPQGIPAGDYDPEHPEAFAAAFRERNRYRRLKTRRLESFCVLFRQALTEGIGLFDESFETDDYAVNDLCARASVEGHANVIAGDVFVHCDGRTPLPALHDRIIFSKKWGDVDGAKPESKPESKKIYCTNALFIADELNQKGQREKAAVTLIDAIKLYPDEKRPHYSLAEILIEDKKYSEAVKVLESMPQGFQKDAARSELMGNCKVYLGLNEEADQYADEILMLDPASAKGWNLKGTVLFQKGAYADAEKSFQKAIEADRSFGEAYANIGALRWASGKREEALKLFEKAFILSPVAEDIVTNYYAAVVQLSKLPEAEKIFREAIALNPFSRRLKFILIDNLLQQGKFQEAMTSMEEAMVAFGVDDDTLTLALKLRDNVWAGLKPAHTGTLEPPDPRTLSVCMIVKNEEDNIMTAIQSIKPVAHEIIVVDTGSSDRTKKIARAFGAKVHDFKWTDSFSDARNFSLSKASGNWVLVLDADEVISPADYEKLKELVTPPTPPYPKRGIKEESLPKGVGTAYSFVTRNYVGPMSANWHPNDGVYKEEAGSGWFPSAKVRLFPNDKRIRFEKPVHETVEDSLLGIGMKISNSGIPIHHYGKLNKDKIHAKGEEYYQLGRKKLSEKGELDPQAIYELAVQATELEKFDEALEFWEKLITVKPGFAKAHYGMGNSYYNLGRYREARAAYKKSAELDPDSKDSLVMYATCELLTGNAGKAISILEEVLRKEPEYPLALLALTTACFCAGRKTEGLAYLKKAQKTQFDLAPYFKDISTILISVKRCDYAISLLEAALETGNETDETRELLDTCRKSQEDSRGEPEQKHPDPVLLSLCMIVKDEEENIERSLLSVKPMVDELIVVDTGSTDRTKDIAQSLGAKVYDFKWTNSFSDARNFSLSKATGKWILALDADEVISPIDHERLRELVTPPYPKRGIKEEALTKEGVVAFSFVTRTYVEQLNTVGWVGNDGQYKDEETGTGWFPGEKVRLFPNDSRFRFEFPLHERIEPSLIKAGVEIRKSDIPVHHYGNFVDKRKADFRAAQNYELGEKKIAERGEQNFMAYYELAIQGAELGKYEESVAYLRKAIALKPDFSKAYQSMGNAHYNLRKYGEALSYYRKAFELKPEPRDARDTMLMYATCEMLTGNAEKTISLIETFVRDDMSFPQALLLLAEANYCLGKKEKGSELAKKLKEMNFDAPQSFMQFSGILGSAGKFRYAVSLLEGAINTGSATAEMPALLAQFRKKAAKEQRK